MAASRLFTAFGQTGTARDWAQRPRCAVPFKTLDWRLRKGWDPEAAITAPANSIRTSARTLTAFGETKQLMTWIDDERCAVSVNTLKQRLADDWDPEAALSTPAMPGRRSDRGVPLTGSQEGELRAAAEKVRRGPRVHRNTPAGAPELAAIRRRDELVRVAIRRGTTVADVAYVAGLSEGHVYAIKGANPRVARNPPQASHCR